MGGMWTSSKRVFFLYWKTAFLFCFQPQKFDGENRCQSQPLIVCSLVWMASGVTSCVPPPPDRRLIHFCHSDVCPVIAVGGARPRLRLALPRDRYLLGERDRRCSKGQSNLSCPFAWRKPQRVSCIIVFCCFPTRAPHLIVARKNAVGSVVVLAYVCLPVERSTEVSPGRVAWVEKELVYVCDRKTYITGSLCKENRRATPRVGSMYG